MKHIKRLNILLTSILILGITYLILGSLFFLYNGIFSIDNFKETTVISITMINIMVDQIYMVFILIGVYHLRIATIEFYNNRLFNELISRKFKHLSFITISGTVLYIVVRWVAQWHFISEINFKIDYFGYSLNAAGALFFFALSIMIEEAKDIQQENDLTI